GGKIALPVYPFANIGRWYRDPAHKPDSNAAAWTYAVWLKGVPDLPSRVSGRLTLPYVFGDNMVLQRHAPVPVWGQAGPGDSVAVRFEEGQPAGGQSGAVVRTARTVADHAGSDAGFSHAGNAYGPIRRRDRRPEKCPGRRSVALQRSKQYGVQH